MAPELLLRTGYASVPLMGVVGGLGRRIKRGLAQARSCLVAASSEGGRSITWRSAVRGESQKSHSQCGRSIISKGTARRAWEMWHYGPFGAPLSASCQQAAESRAGPGNRGNGGVVPR